MSSKNDGHFVSASVCYLKANPFPLRLIVWLPLYKVSATLEFVENPHNDIITTQLHILSALYLKAIFKQSNYLILCAL